MTISIPDVMLGKMPPRRYYADVAVKLKDHIDLKKLFPQVPTTHVYYGKGIDYKMYLNDNLPDCSCSSIGHMTQTHSKRAGVAELPTDDDVMELFHATGVEQGLSDDDGRYMEGVLKHLATKGFRETQEGGQYEKILGYAAVNPHDKMEVMTAIWLFGGLYCGAALPLSAADQIRAGKPWTYSRDTSVNAPGSWGGHAMWTIAFTKKGPRNVTWAERQDIAWKWWDMYVDELYAVVTEDWTQKTESPSGFRRDDLLQLLHEING